MSLAPARAARPAPEIVTMLKPRHACAIVEFEEEHSKKGARFRPTYRVLGLVPGLNVPSSGQISANMAWALPSTQGDLGGWLVKGPRMSANEAKSTAISSTRDGNLSRPRVPPAARWHTRYFLLRGSYLFYMHHPDAENLAGVIPLEGCTIHGGDFTGGEDENMNGVNRRHGAPGSSRRKSRQKQSTSPWGYEIMIKHHERRTFRLLASKKRECHDWMESLQTACCKSATVVPLRTLFPEDKAAFEDADDDCESAAESTAASFAGQESLLDDLPPLFSGKPGSAEDVSPERTKPFPSPDSSFPEMDMSQEFRFVDSCDTTLSLSLVSISMEQSTEQARELLPSSWIQSAVERKSLSIRVVEWEVHPPPSPGSPTNSALTSSKMSCLRDTSCVVNAARCLLNAQYLDVNGQYSLRAGPHNVVFYTLVLTSSAPETAGQGQAVWILRARFSAFLELYRALVARRGRRHVPQPPPKTLLPSTWSTYGHGYLANRKTQIEYWLGNLAQTIAEDQEATDVFLRFLRGQLGQKSSVIL